MAVLYTYVLFVLALVGLSHGRWSDFSETYNKNYDNQLGAGYRRPVPADDVTVQTMAGWAARQLHGSLLRVNTAEEQVVQGIMYYINFTMDDKHKMKKVCYVKIWSRVWLKSIKLMHHKCA